MMSTYVSSTTSLAGPVPGKVTQAALPPCKVCGENASGFHYGVNTCEACKGFFRRCLVRKIPDSCRAIPPCAIVPGKRHGHCATCRYKKCLAVGMSKKAIKTGRYTSEKRTQNIEEVKQMGLQVNIVDTRAQIKSKEEERRQAKLDSIIEVITKAHLETVPNSAEFHREYAAMEAKFTERHALKHELRRDLSREDYQKIYSTTGIDIDGRRELMSTMIPGMENNIRRFITFAKAIPGFKDLPTEDQVTLIKSSRSYTDLIQWCHLLNGDTRTFFSPHLREFITVSDYKSLFPNSCEQIESAFEIMIAIQGLDLTHEEQAILSAIALMNESAMLSHVGWMVREQSVDMLGEAMTLLLERNSDNIAVKLGTMVRLLTELKTVIGENVSFMEHSILLNYPGVINPEQHQLWVEVTGVLDGTQREDVKQSEVERLCNSS